MFDREYFDAGLYRIGTACEKWDGCRERNGADVLPMWVADMDFPSPPEIQEALLRRAAHPTYGYTEVQDSLLDAFRNFWNRRHGSSFERDEITMLPCVVTGLKIAIQALTKPWDGVIIQSPVYGPFRMAVEAAGRTLMDAPLIRRENGRYEMDLEAVEVLCRAGAKLMMLCSPHNPVSRVWNREELNALLDILNRYGVILVSDVSMLNVQRERTITLAAPSKTFNIAGLQTAFAIIADDQIRRAFRKAIEAGGVVSGNIFGMEAARAAFLYGEPWLDGLLDYLTGNRAVLESQVSMLLPRAIMTPMEATYLGWLDLRSYGFPEKALMERTRQAGVVFTNGTFFGNDSGEGFLRINIGCPRRNVQEAIKRLSIALDG